MIELITIVTAIIVTYIAWQQYRTNRYKLNLDLFDRRWKIWKSLQTLLTKSLEGHVDLSDIDNFRIEIKNATFLFGDEVLQYLEGVSDKIYRQKVLQDQLKNTINLPAGKERKRISKEESELFEWIHKQFDVSKTVFKEYMYFGGWKHL
jgi:hypothetical protein